MSKFKSNLKNQSFQPHNNPNKYNKKKINLLLKGQFNSNFKMKSFQKLMIQKICLFNLLQLMRKEKFFLTHKSKKF